VYQQHLSDLAYDNTTLKCRIPTPLLAFVLPAQHSTATSAGRVLQILERELLGTVNFLKAPLLHLINSITSP